MVRTRRILVFSIAAAAALAFVFLVDWRPVAAEVRFRSRVERVESYAEQIRYAAAESGQDPYFLAAVMYVESGGKVDAVSSVDALGLYQLMLPTAKERARLLGMPEPTRESLLTDAAANIRLGASYLKWLEIYCDGDLERMLVTYNAGPGRVKKWTDEAGGWEAWRAERKAAGDSSVLAYARRVQRYRDRFAARGRIVPEGTELPDLGDVPSGFVQGRPDRARAGKGPEE